MSVFRCLVVVGVVAEINRRSGADETGLKWGAAGMQGWRTGMEDSHLACLDLNGGGGGVGGKGDAPAGATAADSAAGSAAAAASPDRDPSKRIAAFAVFDGHVSVTTRLLGVLRSNTYCCIDMITERQSSGEHGGGLHGARRRYSILGRGKTYGTAVPLKTHFFLLLQYASDQNR